MNIVLFSAATPNGHKVSIALEELGLPYQLRALDLGAKEQKEPWFLAINPNGRVPAMDDEGYRLFESLAINLYLVKRQGGSLAPSDAKEEGKAVQWSMWALTELEDAFIALLVRHQSSQRTTKGLTLPPWAHGA